MSKRPNAGGNAVLSRLRRPVGRLRDMPIWSKLGLIMIVPTLATIVVGTNGLVDNLETATDADRTRILSAARRRSPGHWSTTCRTSAPRAVMLLAADDEHDPPSAQDGVRRREQAGRRAPSEPYTQQRSALVDVDRRPCATCSSSIDTRPGQPARRAQPGRPNAKIKHLRRVDALPGADHSTCSSIRDSAAQLAGSGDAR